MGGRDQREERASSLRHCEKKRESRLIHSRADFSMPTSLEACSDVGVQRKRELD
jgi:hypothetical protein